MAAVFHWSTQRRKNTLLLPWLQDAPIFTFVAIFPVTLDAVFKYWIFKGLNAKNPAAAVTLKSLDRH